MMKTSILCLAVILQYVNANARNEFILSEVKKCDFANQDAAEVNRCFFYLIDLIMKENERIGRSVKENAVMNLFVPEPVNIGGFPFVQSDGPLNIKANFSNVNIFGLSKFSLKSVEASYKDRIITMVIEISPAQMEGQYVMDGNVILLPVEGSGDFFATAKNVSLKLNFKMIVNKLNNGVMGIDNMIGEVSIGKIDIQFMDLFVEDAILDETMHHFLNTNENLIKDAIIPTLNIKMEKVMTGIMNDVFSNIPRTAIYPSGNI